MSILPMHKIQKREKKIKVQNSNTQNKGCIINGVDRRIFY